MDSTCSTLKSNLRIIEDGRASSAKPPNVVIYSDDSSCAECLKATLSLSLEKQRYTIYILNRSQMLTAPWLNNVCLVVIAGDVPLEMTWRLKAYVTQGRGRLLCFASNMLGVFVPALAGVNLCEKLTSFSYAEWKRVQLVHRLMETQQLTDSQSIASFIPRTIKVEDNNNRCYEFDITTFGGVEEESTSRTPSLIVATKQSGEKAVFCNMHLEIDSKNEQFKKYNQVLSNNNEIRVKIFIDILGRHLGLECSDSLVIEPDYEPGFLFGETWLKMQFLNSLKNRMNDEGELQLSKYRLKFLRGEFVRSIQPSSLLMPISVESHVGCDAFSQELYFEYLKTQKIGRLVIFSKVMTSSMFLVDSKMMDGLVVIPYSQTRGVGRGKNAWLSPEGCAMFSLQVHARTRTPLTDRLGFLQHCATLAAVMSVRSLPGLEELDICLKWPNDIYAYKSLKIGGAIATSTVGCQDAICNLGVGVNLSNRLPTTCINQMIEHWNEKNGTNIPTINLEKFIANLLNKFEKLLNMIQHGKIADVLDLYYKYWLHSDSKVSVRFADGSLKEVQIKGIDDCGFLRVVDAHSKLISVHPDGNSFDMLSGLIAPKVL